jgi:hypothetical protein
VKKSVRSEIHIAVSRVVGTIGRNDRVRMVLRAMRQLPQRSKLSKQVLSLLIWSRILYKTYPLAHIRYLRELHMDATHVKHTLPGHKVFPNNMYHLVQRALLLILEQATLQESCLFFQPVELVQCRFRGSATVDGRLQQTMMTWSCCRLQWPGHERKLVELIKRILVPPQLL